MFLLTTTDISMTFVDYRNVASSYLNQKAPIISKEITVKETGGNWYNSEICEAKKVM